MKISILLLWVFSPFLLVAQFAPAVGMPGTSAVHKDSLIIKAWATECLLFRGYKDIANSDSGFVSVGDELAALGKAGENGVVSLGDGGVAIIGFEAPLFNGPGPDFAIFENAFNNSYLELAFVEVSSDGLNYFRFPATSFHDTLDQFDNNAQMEAEKINNLAGKYRALYGTPFDLEELMGIPELDINNITHIKIIDVVGSLNDQYATRDQYQNKINDPWPTPWASGGFDLDAIGAMYLKSTFVPSKALESVISIFPNPIKYNAELTISKESLSENYFIELIDFKGKIIYSTSLNSSTLKLPEEIGSGLYLLRIINSEKIQLISKLLIH